MSATGTPDSKRSVGEELYLVHLSRHSKQQEVDIDRDKSTISSGTRTPGEELWLIHCERSKERRLEEEEEENQLEHAHMMMQNQEPARVYHLRNRDVPAR